MAAPANGTVVLVRFPFSDLSGSKLRPAFVLTQAGRGDVVLCQITSQPFTDNISIEIGISDFQSGTLTRTSFARPGKLFTANQSIITRTVGEVVPGKLAEIIGSVIRLFELGTEQ